MAALLNVDRVAISLCGATHEVPLTIQLFPITMDTDRCINHTTVVSKNVLFS